MGHGDSIVLADGNFPAEALGRHSRTIRLDGHSIPDILSAILTLMPLDTYVAQPVTLMEIVPGDPTEVPVWEQYKHILSGSGFPPAGKIAYLERFAFYQKAAAAYTIVATGERAIYANIILQKGVVKEP